VADVRPLPLVRDLKVKHPNADAYFQFARNTVKGDGEELPGAAQVRGLRRAVAEAKFDEGMAFEREHLHRPDVTPECKALRHAFFGRARRQQDPRRARRHAAAQGEEGGVIGAGTMGGGIT
jgi:3-hydroxyacyl-CoA dehydrogenase